MKKTYLMPDVLVTTIQLQQMIALSLNDDEADPNGEVLSRQRRSKTIWDDEEEEEDY